MADVIGVSIVKQNFDTSNGGTSNRKTGLVEDKFRYNRSNTYHVHFFKSSKVSVYLLGTV